MAKEKAKVRIGKINCPDCAQEGVTTSVYVYKNENGTLIAGCHECGWHDHVTTREERYSRFEKRVVKLPGVTDQAAPPAAVSPKKEEKKGETKSEEKKAPAQPAKGSGLFV